MQQANKFKQILKNELKIEFLKKKNTIIEFPLLTYKIIFLPNRELKL